MIDGERHESYATMSFSKATSSHSIPLFGSSILHSDIIILAIQEATLRRHLSQDWALSGKTVLQAEMSHKQFADLITSMNQGGGTPITLSYVAGDTKPRRATPPGPKHRQHFEQEFKEAMEAPMASLDELISQAKGKLKRQLEGIRAQMQNRMPFVETQFARQMEHTTNEAKAEIEAFFNAREQMAGIPVLQDEQERDEPGALTEQDSTDKNED